MFFRILTLALLLCRWSAAQQPAAPPIHLTLRRAIEMALQGRAPELTIAETSERIAEARYQSGRAGMWPVFEAAAAGQNVTRNLNAEGFRFNTNVPGLTIPKSVGPFNTLDARVSVTQSVFDAGALRRSRAVQA